jgi:hypothetical protein
MIRISHESPLSLLEQSRNYNDYDYALVHLFEEVEEYYLFFRESLLRGREVVLDNSIFELGEAFDSDKFAYWIKQLKPTTYIVPDVLENCQATILKLHDWIEKYENLPGLKMGVLQGKTYEEFVNCHREIDRCCDRIAISFDYSYYNESIGSEDELFNWMKGRQTLIDRLVEDKVINFEKKYHLLGCSLPQEFNYYSKYPFIHSLDTSNPIVHGIKKVTYKPFGLKGKERVKLVDLIHSNLDEDQLSAIEFNIRKFKQLVNG